LQHKPHSKQSWLEPSELIDCPMLPQYLSHATHSFTLQPKGFTC
jgi:hypothetical protein